MPLVQDLSDVFLSFPLDKSEGEAPPLPFTVRGLCVQGTEEPGQLSEPMLQESVWADQEPALASSS